MLMRSVDCQVGCVNGMRNLWHGFNYRIFKVQRMCREEAGKCEVRNSWYPVRFSEKQEVRRIPVRYENAKIKK